MLASGRFEQTLMTARRQRGQVFSQFITMMGGRQLTRGHEHDLRLGARRYTLRLDRAAPRRQGRQ